MTPAPAFAILEGANQTRSAKWNKIAHSLSRTGVLASILVPIAAGNVTADSFVLIFRTEEASIIAADSKESWTQGLDGGLTCKVHITNDIVWATTGLVRQLSGPFDVWATAKSALAMDGGLDRIVSQFQSDTASQLKILLPWLRAANLESYKEATKLPYVVTSAFMQKDTVKFTYFLVPEQNAPENVEVIRHECPGADCPTGQLQLMMGEHAAIDMEVARHPDVWKDKGLVGAINYLVGIQSAATPKSVAGPAAILHIDKSGSLSWIQNGKCN